MSYHNFSVNSPKEELRPNLAICRTGTTCKQRSCRTGTRRRVSADSLNSLTSVRHASVVLPRDSSAKDAPATTGVSHLIDPCSELV
eukprot:366015-Chlamydomonas_euryale.AAC.8